MEEENAKRPKNEELINEAKNFFDSSKKDFKEDIIIDKYIEEIEQITG